MTGSFQTIGHPRPVEVGLLVDRGVRGAFRRERSGHGIHLRTPTGPGAGRSGLRFPIMADDRLPDGSRAAHRPVRADHGGGRAGRRHRRPRLRVRGLRPPAAARPPLRRPRRHRPAPRGARRASASATTSSTPCATQGLTDARLLDWLAGLPLHRRRRRLRRGRPLLPRLPGAHRPRRRSPRACCWRPWPCRSSTTTAPSPRRPPAWSRPPASGRASRWARAAPTRRPRSPRPAPPTWSASRRRPTWRPAGATASRPPAPARTPSPCCTTTRSRRSAARWPPSARRRRCWSTPTTSSRASERRSRSPGRSSARIRLDSGDLPTLATQARELLDELGATRTRIVVTSDLDEYAIAALRAAPVDGYGVGTSLVTGSGAPTAGMVYKLVERDGVPVAKKSEGKDSVGGRKRAVRRHDADGTATAEVVSSDGPDRGPGRRPRPRRAAGHAAASCVDPADPVEALARARAHHEQVRAALPPEALGALPRRARRSTP